ncbi:phosphoribosylanthranilate isomerase [Neobacillus sp. LXY-1]|uniref:phosphoribosylanthranilate isomerase n=1 Tax=Neobacillus sp. LXY-1 TaxID=3379133 RepID=UPI003EE3B643
MKVKICGIMDVKTGVAAASFGADAIGFVFAESKRKVTEQQAREIISQLPEHVCKVGVFVNEKSEEINRIASVTGLTHIQLHGDETVEFSQSISLPVIKAISFQDNEVLAKYNLFPAEYVLLDGPKGKYRGGNGTPFDWNGVNIELLRDKKIILAGGLNSDNIDAAIKIIHPYMVDVSSGVETDGFKDLSKVKTFIEKAKGTLVEGK